MLQWSMHVLLPLFYRQQSLQVQYLAVAVLKSDKYVLHASSNSDVCDHVFEIDRPVNAKGAEFLVESGHRISSVSGDDMKLVAFFIVFSSVSSITTPLHSEKHCLEVQRNTDYLKCI